jgi:hypothetical protein
MRRSHLLGAVKTLDEDGMRNEASAILDRLGIVIPQMRLEIEKLSGGQRQAWPSPVPSTGMLAS